MLSPPAVAWAHKGPATLNMVDQKMGRPRSVLTMFNLPARQGYYVICILFWFVAHAYGDLKVVLPVELPSLFFPFTVTFPYEHSVADDAF